MYAIHTDSASWKNYAAQMTCMICAHILYCWTANWKREEMSGIYLYLKLACNIYGGPALNTAIH